MNKLKVALVLGGVAVAAGYVYRKPLSAAANRYTDIAHGFVLDLIEDAKQKRHNAALKRHDHSSAWVYDDDPEADPVPSRTAGQ